MRKQQEIVRKVEQSAAELSRRSVGRPDKNGMTNESASMTLGEILRRERQAKGLSLNQLAKGAGIGGATLSRWENGASAPRMAELEAVLNTLSSTPQFRAMVLAMIPAPRAIQQLKAVTAAPPSQQGELLRSLRVRRGWTQAALARQIGVSQSHLAKWERSEVLPSFAQFQEALRLLDADPREVDALLPTEPSYSYPLSALDNEGMAHFIGDLINGVILRTELIHFAVEQRLWGPAQKDETARMLLIITLLLRVRDLRNVEEHHEAAIMARRVEALLTTITPSHRVDYTVRNWPVTPNHVRNELDLTYAIGAIRRRRRLQREADRLLPAMAQEDRPEYRAWMMAEAANLMLLCSEPEWADSLSQRATVVARRSGNWLEPQFRLRDRASVLVALHRYEEALETLEQALPLAAFHPDCDVRHRLLAIECLLALGRRDQASEQVHHLRQIPETIALRHLLPAIRSVERQF